MATGAGAGLAQTESFSCFTRIPPPRWLISQLQGVCGHDRESIFPRRTDHGTTVRVVVHTIGTMRPNPSSPVPRIYSSPPTGICTPPNRTNTKHLAPSRSTVVEASNSTSALTGNSSSSGAPIKLEAITPLSPLAYLALHWVMWLPFFPHI